MSTANPDDKPHYTDEDLRALAKSKHAHDYVEMWDSRRDGRRTFKCVECGLKKTINQVTGHME